MAYKLVLGYVSPINFAKNYSSKRTGETGVSREYINRIIKIERAKPGTTDIDVLEIDGHFYVRNKRKRARRKPVVVDNPQ